MTTERPTLSVLQFNTWLLAFPLYAFATDYSARRKVMPELLAAQGADLISLQEVWVNRDKQYLEDSLRPYGYGHFLYTRHRFGLGDGMFLASKYPIGRVERSRPFRTATRFIEILPAKRAIAAVVDYPGVGEIDFYQTHLGSVLFDEKTRAPNATSRRKLLVQLLEVADFIRSHRKSEFAILTGDLNFHYQAHEGERGYGVRYADEYRKFLETLHIAGLTVENSFLVANGMDETHAAIPTFSQENPYAREGFTRNPEETLDYVLFAPSPRWKPVESKVVFRERVSERIPALSDHYGIRTTFEFSSPEKR